VEAERYAKYLAGFKALAEAAVAGMPNNELEDATPHVVPLAAATVVAERLDRIERMCRLAEWRDSQRKRWSDWWTKLTPSENTDDESLSSHLRHLRARLENHVS
jgi:hypothetical protein